MTAKQIFNFIHKMINVIKIFGEKNSSRFGSLSVQLFVYILYYIHISE